MLLELAAEAHYPVASLCHIKSEGMVDYMDHMAVIIICEKGAQSNTLHRCGHVYGVDACREKQRTSGAAGLVPCKL